MRPLLSLKRTALNIKDFTLGPLEADLYPGTVMGLIGPNGAGKTTTLRLIIGLLTAHSGEIFVDGMPNNPDQSEWKRRIGFVSDEPMFYENWNSIRNLNFLAHYYPNWSTEKVEKLAHRFDLDLTKAVKKLSKGNRVKLALIAALAHTPKLLIFDEPTAGLDPIVRCEVLDVLFEEMSDGNRGLLYSTHNLGDLERLADELTFINKGQIFARQSKDELINSWGKISYRSSNGPFARLPSVVREEREGGWHIVISENRNETLEALKHHNADHIDTSRLGLDEIVIEILEGANHVASR